MASYKWWLLTYQLFSTAFDFVYTTLLMPVMLFPTMMAYADSYIARWISLSTVTGPWIHAAVLITCCAPSFVAFIDFVPDQVQAREKVLQEYSCARAVVNEPRLLILSRDHFYQTFIIGVTIDFFGAILVLCTLSLSYYFLRQTNHMSRKTRLMQRRYLFLLCIQVSVPAVTLGTPIGGFLIIWFAMSVPIGQENEIDAFSLSHLLVGFELNYVHYHAEGIISVCQRIKLE
ncbi:unnamed protein product [Cylicocyclus nassatus]|uniref:G protein-coupled receptor n=1 Tax=Cylicocyclus nassatus TaxID=53992 RepID=A0AA36GUF1_CYLNA|nr:unnamed protein product [Cylicocyclus nassatus]